MLVTVHPLGSAVPGGCFRSNCQAFLTLIIYHAFIYLNLKPAIRKNKSEEYWAKLMAAEVYGDLTPNAMSP